MREGGEVRESEGGSGGEEGWEVREGGRGGMVGGEGGWEGRVGGGRWG